MSGTLNLSVNQHITIDNSVAYSAITLAAGAELVLAPAQISVSGPVDTNGTIAGGGAISAGNSTLSFTNEAAGVIDADLIQTLTLDLQNDQVFNSGLVEATNTGGLQLTSTTIDNAGGTVLAAGAGAAVTLRENSIIKGGLIETTAGGSIQIVGGYNNSTDTFDGSTAAVTLAAGTQVDVTDNQVLNLKGMIVNAGTIAMDGTTGGGSLIVNSPTVTLTGGGEIVLDADPGTPNLLGGNTSNGVNTLVNVNNTIAGAGVIVGNGSTAFSLINENAGVINANLFQTLTLELPSDPLVNTGLVEATNTGGLQLTSTTIDNAGGTVLAAGAGAAVTLRENSIILGGLIETSAGGSIQIVGGYNNSTDTFDGSTAAVTLAAGTQVDVTDNQVLNLKGMIVNAGTIAMDGTTGGGNLIVNSPTVTLTGGGEIVLDANGNNSNFIGGNTSNGVNTLVNVNNLISGSGQIATGNGSYAVNIDNAAGGTIESTGSLVIGSAITGAGALLIDNGASMELTTNVAGQNVVFGGSSATLRLDKPIGFGGTIDGFGAGNSISFAGFYGDTTSTFDGSNLVVTDSGTIVNTFRFVGSYLPGQIEAVDSKSGNVTIEEVGPSGVGLPAVSGAFTNAVYSTLLSTLNAITPAGTTPNTVSVAAGGSGGSPIAGALNVIAVTTSGGGAALTLPAGFKAGYLTGGGTSLQDTVGGAVLVATSANDTLTGVANDTLFGGNANTTLIATAGAETLYGGTGSNLIELGASSALANTQGSDTIVGSTTSATVNAGGAALYFGGAGSTLFNSLGASSTLVGGGAQTVNAGGANMLMFGGAGAIDFNAGSGASTVVSGTGGATINGGSGGLLYFGTGPTTYNAGAAVDTVLGFTGTLTATGGANGTLFFTGTGGANDVSTGSGSSTIIGFGVNDTLVATGGGSDVIAAAAASETVYGANSTGNNTFFAFGANDVLVGGSGSTALESGLGNHTLIAGSGSTLFEILNSGMRSVTIENFNPGQDYVQFQGYATGTAAAALQSATVSGGNEILTLADGTRVTFQGVTNLTTSSFI